MSEPPAGWERTTFGRVATYLNGFAFKPEDWSERGTPIVRIAQMTNPDASFDYYEGTLPEQFCIDSGDLLFSWSATLAALIWGRGPAYLNQHLFKVVPAEGVERAFLHHLLNLHMDGLAGQAHGTTMRHIKRTDLRRFEVDLPSVPEQRHIARILDTLDSAVSKTEQLIAKLKLLKQGLLHDLLTRGIDEDGELRDRERHPESFKDSQLGRIPRGWSVDRLETWLGAPPRNGYSPPEASEWTGVLMLGLGCLTADGFEPLQLKNAPYGDRKLEPARLRDGDLLMSRANTRELVGLVGVYRDVGSPCTYPDLMMRLTPNSDASVEFLELALSSIPVRRQIQMLASGTSESMVKVSATIVRGLLVAMPSPAEQRLITEAYRATRERLDSEMCGLSKLRLIKRGLVDDLLTGRVRVTGPDAAA